MKKIFLFLIALVFTAQMLLAVPSGTYSDDRGHQRVLVTDNGTICTLDDNGYVKQTFTVVQENSDGSFIMRAVVNGNLVGEPIDNNNWWRGNDGKIYLNLKYQLRTLTRD